MSEYKRKYQAAMSEQEAANLPMPLPASVMQNAAHKIGFPIRPPYHSTYWRTALSMALFFGPTWGIAMWFISWRADAVPLTVAFGTAALAGILFGLIMGVFYVRQRRKLNLTPWDEL